MCWTCCDLLLVSSGTQWHCPGPPVAAARVTTLTSRAAVSPGPAVPQRLSGFFRSVAGSVSDGSSFAIMIVPLAA